MAGLSLDARPAHVSDGLPARFCGWHCEAWLVSRHDPDNSLHDPNRRVMQTT
jgi:hypothetical protein